jgi:hypothetical protein
MLRLHCKVPTDYAPQGFEGGGIFIVAATCTQYTTESAERQCFLRCILPTLLVRAYHRGRQNHH